MKLNIYIFFKAKFFLFIFRLSSNEKIAKYSFNYIHDFYCEAQFK